ncbi:Unknown protein, partial [Striga hermonthica]
SQTGPASTQCRPTVVRCTQHSRPRPWQAGATAVPAPVQPAVAPRPWQGRGPSQPPADQSEQTGSSVGPNSGHSDMTLDIRIFLYDSRVLQDSRQYLSATFGDSSRDLCALVISQNVITYSVMLNFLNVQMPPRREPDHQAPTQATVVAQFRDYHAEKFSGQGDPRIVDEWIQGLEFIFEVMDCPDRYRVICAQLQLTGDARLWWNAYWSMRPGEKAGCTWDMLKELVREKYYPSYYRAEMERKFLALQQGTRTVDEYEREFTRLAAFVPDLVRTEAQRAQRFIDGLFPAVRHNIVGHGTQTYARAVSIAQEVDASIRRETVRDRAQPSAPVLPFVAPPALPAAQPTKEKKRKGKGAQTNRRTRQRQQPIPPCPSCGRLHRGECH